MRAYMSTSLMLLTSWSYIILHLSFFSKSVPNVFNEHMSSDLFNACKGERFDEAIRLLATASPAEVNYCGEVWRSAMRILLHMILLC